MKQVVVFKLEPDASQHAALLATLEEFNSACQFAGDIAFEHKLANKIALQPLVYRDLRDKFGLSSQMAIRAIAKAVEAYKRDRSIRPAFRPHGAMVYDELVMSFKGVTHVSLLSLAGRLIIPLRCGAYQKARFDRVKGQADLIYRDGTFYLYATIDLPSPPSSDTSGGILGVDLGIVNIAVDADGDMFSGAEVRAVRYRMKRLKAGLQSCGTKSAKRHLRKFKHRQRRFIRNMNHIVSKRLVEKAQTSRRALALEDLSGIRERANGFSRKMRWLMGNWSFDELRRFIVYKAETAGIPVFFVDPRNTSRTCHACGHCAKKNRKDQSHFVCQRCGLDMNADVNASRNIAARAAEVLARAPESAGLWSERSAPV